MERWTYNPNDENEPRANLNFGGEEIEANRGNTRLYTFIGHAALNHVFVRLNGDRGAYIFNFVEGYDTLARYMIENNYPAYINQTEAPQVDIDAYDRAIAKMAEDADYIPEEWEKGE